MATQNFTEIVFYPKVMRAFLEYLSGVSDIKEAEGCVQEMIESGAMKEFIFLSLVSMIQCMHLKNPKFSLMENDNLEKIRSCMRLIYDGYTAEIATAQTFNYFMNSGENAKKRPEIVREIKEIVDKVI